MEKAFAVSFDDIRLILIVEFARYIMPPFNLLICAYIGAKILCSNAFSQNVGKWIRVALIYANAESQ